ncbi:MAG: hypothetical protein ABFS14_06995 [Gemmatimonadota bacterium]
MIERVIDRNVDLFDFVIERASTGADMVSPSEEESVLSFFRHVEASNPEQFETLKDLILGSTLAGLLRRTEIADATRSFRPTTVYLDTNFLLSALNLRFPVECRPALELLRLLNQNARFKLRVFDFTLEEVFALLRGFNREGAKYPVGVPIRSLYASMKSQGFSPAGIAELIATIEDQLEELGVAVLSTGVRIEDTLPTDPDTLSRYSRYKPEQEERGRKHDLQAIAFVAKARSRQVRRVEDAGVFFLTEDARLSNYAFIEMGHRDGETISEVMPDRLLTNLLWLKDPQILEQLPVATVIAMHSRDLFIDKAVWLRFFGVLTALQEGGDLDDDAASILLYDAQVQNDLAILGAIRVAEVDEAWVLSRLEKARQQAEWKHEWELSRQAAELQTSYAADDEQRAQKYSSRITALEERIQLREADVTKALATVKQRMERRATWLVRGIKGIVLLAVGAAAYFLVPVLFSKWEIAEPALALVALLVALMSWLGFKVEPLHIWERFRYNLQGFLIRGALRDWQHIANPSADGQLALQPRSDSS